VTGTPGTSRREIPPQREQERLGPHGRHPSVVGRVSAYTACVAIQAHGETGRQQRDALERLQEELREARRRRDELPRENAGLEADVERVEQEVHGLHQEVAAARAEAERPASSLPVQLVPPFEVRSSRGTPYGRLRFALRGIPLPLLPLIQAGVSGRGRRTVVLGVFLLFCVGLRLVLQGPEDDSEPTWSFGEEGFTSTHRTVQGGGSVLYADVTKVEVRQGLLQRLFGFGSVRVTCAAAASSRSRGGEPRHRTLRIGMLDEPQRLAEWLRGRVEEAKRVR
jgi:Bacterial PH domain